MQNLNYVWHSSLGKWASVHYTKCFMWKYITASSNPSPNENQKISVCLPASSSTIALTDPLRCIQCLDTAWYRGLPITILVLPWMTLHRICFFCITGVCINDFNGSVHSYNASLILTLIPSIPTDIPRAVLPSSHLNPRNSGSSTSNISLFYSTNVPIYRSLWIPWPVLPNVKPTLRF